jgi:hypothetical protein
MFSETFNRANTNQLALKNVSGCNTVNIVLFMLSAAYLIFETKCRLCNFNVFTFYENPGYIFMEKLKEGFYFYLGE